MRSECDGAEVGGGGESPGMGPPPPPPPPAMPPAMSGVDPPRVYRLLPEGFRTARRRVWLRLAVMAVVAVGFLLLMNRGNGFQPSFLAVIPLVLALLAFAAVRAVGRLG